MRWSLVVLIALASGCSDGGDGASASTGSRPGAHQAASTAPTGGARPDEGLDVFEPATAPADLAPFVGTEGDRLCADDGGGDDCRRAPRIRGEETDDGFVPLVSCGEPADVTRVELRASFGNSHVTFEGDTTSHPFRWRLPEADDVRYYHLFMDAFGGHLVVRIHYADGEVWRRTVRLAAQHLRPEG